jgi:hypothetical protein
MDVNLSSGVDEDLVPGRESVSCEAFLAPAEATGGSRQRRLVRSHARDVRGRAGGGDRAGGARAAARHRGQVCLPRCRCRTMPLVLQAKVQQAADGRYHGPPAEPSSRPTRHRCISIDLSGQWDDANSLKRGGFLYEVHMEPRASAMNRSSRSTSAGTRPVPGRPACGRTPWRSASPTCRRSPTRSGWAPSTSSATTRAPGSRGTWPRAFPNGYPA